MYEFSEHATPYLQNSLGVHNMIAMRGVDRTHSGARYACSTVLTSVPEDKIVCLTPEIITSYVALTFLSLCKCIHVRQAKLTRRRDNTVRLLQVHLSRARRVFTDYDRIKHGR